MKTLREVREEKVELSREEKQSLLKLLTARCSVRTTGMIDRIIESNRLLDLPSAWYWERLVIVGTGTKARVQYIAGQDYVAEIACIRKDLIKQGTK